MASEALQAFYGGDLERARALLRPDDELGIFDAAAFGRVDRLRALLTDDPSLAAAFADDGFTALHLAVYGGHEEAAEALIAAGADVNARSTGTIAQVPPLGTAAFVRSLPLALLLLDAGADVNSEGAGGFTALDSAFVNGDVALIRELEARGGRRNRT